MRCRESPTPPISGVRCGLDGCWRSSKQGRYGLVAIASWMTSAELVAKLEAEKTLPSAYAQHRTDIYNSYSEQEGFFIAASHLNESSPLQIGLWTNYSAILSRWGTRFIGFIPSSFTILVLFRSRVRINIVVINILSLKNAKNLNLQTLGQISFSLITGSIPQVHCLFLSYAAIAM